MREKWLAPPSEFSTKSPDAMVLVWIDARKSYVVTPPVSSTPLLGLIYNRDLLLATRPIKITKLIDLEMFSSASELATRS